MSSTLVETVSINYEDFSDSFLTCGTCLSTFDGHERTPKLLPCSHSVCRSCLERIVESQVPLPPASSTSSRGEATAASSVIIRCPICRETITVPRGGVSAFPPSYLVNQLLDLMSRQRRDVVPKCTVHSQQELMFCETCDTIFCTDCTGGMHGISVGSGGHASSTQGVAHTVIPFSIAIKRMSEILLYKAGQCTRNLDSAASIVADEMARLDVAVERCVESISRTFQEALELMDKRRYDLLQVVRRIRDEKHRILKEQLDIVQAEKGKVEADCRRNLQQQIEVRSITKKIGELDEMLDVSTTLLEPRENAFLQFEFRHNGAMNDLSKAVAQMGRIRISTTFPALCTAEIIGGDGVGVGGGVMQGPHISTPSVQAHIEVAVLVTTVDYYGSPRTTGCDPVTAEVTDERGGKVTTDVTDKEDGSYTIKFTPATAGRHRLSVAIFNRPIGNSPLTLDVGEHNSPTEIWGKKGDGAMEFLQPVGITVGEEDRVFVLDAGNCRVKVLDPKGRLLRLMTGVGLEQHSATGIAFTPEGTILVVNWRTRQVTELDGTSGALVHQFTHADLVEPVAIAINGITGEIFVADNGLGQVFVFDRRGAIKLATFGSKGDGKGQFRLVTSLAVGAKEGEILVVDGRVQAFTCTGQFLYELGIESESGAGTKIPKGQFGGVIIDRWGRYLATRVERGTCFVQVFGADRAPLFTIDSFDSKLSPRPSALATLSSGHVVVVDLGNNCVKKYRYM